MLWNLSDLEAKERLNKEYKYLVDLLRVTSLMPYLLSRYYEDAKKELAKVDWTMQSSAILKEFNKPIWFLKVKYELLKYGSKIMLGLRKIMIQWKKAF